MQDEWELDDNEYLSRRELQEAYDREEKRAKNNDNDIPKNNDNDIPKNNDIPKSNDNDIPNEEDKRWLDVDTPGNGMYCTIVITLGLSTNLPYSNNSS